MKHTIRKLFFLLFILWGSLIPAQANDEHVYINPLYQNLPVVKSQEISSNGAATYTTSSLADASDYVREQLKKRSTSFSLRYSGSTNVFDSTYWNNRGYSNFFWYLMDTSMAHTGNPTEGDYLEWHFQSISDVLDDNTCSGSGTYNYCFEFTASYLDSASHQSAASSACSSILSSLNLSGKSDYEKVKAIYNWLTANVTYDDSDYDMSSSTPYLKHTAYAALVQHHAVCQGYTTAFYRMCLAAGVDCRAIPSVRYNDEGHIWDIAKIGSYYYNLDATWDAGLDANAWKYFLTSMDDFTDDIFHTRDSEYLTDAFMAAYPMAPESYNPSSSAQVTGLKATVSGTTVKLSWSTLAGAKSYYIYQSASKSSGFSKIGTSSSTALSVTNLSKGKTYYFKVRALMSSGDYSEYSSVVKVTIPNPQVTGLKATVSGTTAKLSWSTLSGAKSYYVYQSASKSSGFSKIGTSSSTALSVTNLSKGKTYYFKVRAKMSSGDYSEYSSVVKVTIPNPQVTGLKATVSGTTAKLSWSTLSGAKKYYIYQSASKSSGFSKIGTSSSTALSVTNLSKGKTYYFKVRAKMSSGDYSKYSSVLTVKVPKPQVTGLKATLSGNTANLTWDSFSGAKYYLVYQSLSKSSGFKKIGTGNSASLKVKKLSYGETYYFRVRAKLKSGYSEYSAAIKVTVPKPQVTGLKATVSGTSAKLSWDTLSDAKKYYIYRSVYKDSGFSKIGTASGTSYNVKGLSKGKTYYFKVRAKMSTGDYSKYSSVVKAVISKGNASGTFGTCKWEISNGTLILSPSSGSSCTLGNTVCGTYTINRTTKAPWDSRNDITSVKINQTVKAGNSAAILFFGLSNLTDISGLSKLDVSGTTTMRFMFSGCKSLKNLKGLKSWDVSNVSDMGGLFSNCDTLTNLTSLENWDISGAETMEWMFSDDYALTSLNGLQYWDSSNVSNMYGMFMRCTSLSNVSALKDWDFSNVTSSWAMLSDTRVKCSTISEWNFPEYTMIDDTSCQGSIYAVSGLKASSKNTSVKLTWAAPADAKTLGSELMNANASATKAEQPVSVKSYEIYRSTSPSSGFKKIGTATAASYDISDLSYGKTYYFKVRALMSDGSYGEFSNTVTAIISAAAKSSSSAVEVTEECSEDGSTCTISEKVCTKTECTVTSKVCVVVGDQKACAEPVVTVVPVLTETPAVTKTPMPEAAATETPAPTATETPAVAEPAAEVTEECSEDGSTCTISEKVCTETECTITSKVCVVVGDQKACAEPVMTVVPVVTETPTVTEEVPTETEEPAATEEAPAEPAATEEVPTEEPAATEEVPAEEPAATEEVPAEEPAATEEVPAEEPAATEEAPAEPAATEEAPAEPVATEEAPAEPAATEEVPAEEPAATEEAPAEPAATEEAPAEPAATEEVPAEPVATEEAPAEPAVTEEAPAEPAVTEEAPAEPVATEDAPAEPAVTEEAPAEPAAAAAVPEEPAATEDLTIREINIEDLKEDTITFNAQESFTIEPEKLKVIPEAADWTALSFKLDDESIAVFKSTDIEAIKAEGLTLNGLVQGTTTLRIQAGDVEKTVTLVINMSAAEAEALAQAEAAAAAPEEVPAE